MNFDTWFNKHHAVKTAYSSSYIVGARKGFEAGQQSQQDKIDAAMRLLQTRQHNPDVANIIFEMHKILKGPKDE